MKRTLNSFIEEWFKVVVCNSEAPLAVGTYDRYRGIHRNKIVKGIGLEPVEKVNRVTLLKYCRKLQASGCTRSDIAGRLSVINGGLGMAFDEEIGAGSVQGLLKTLYRNKAKPKAQIVPFTPEESKRIIDSTRECDKLLVIMLLSTGCRIGELLGLNFDSINFAEKYVLIRRSFRGGVLSENTKNGVERTVPVGDEIMRRLETCRKTRNEKRLQGKDSDAVFLRNDKRLGQNSFRYSWCRILERAGLDHRKIHTCRHTVASQLLNAGHPAKLVAEILGHSVQVLLSTYSHLLNSSEEQKREMLLSLDIGQSNNNAKTRTYTKTNTNTIHAIG